jgi:hypothetical protein
MSLIRNEKRVTQAIDFTGIQSGKIHPTDIDFVLEFDNKVLILGEVKYKGNPIPTGQRLVLERICDSWVTKKALVLKVEHEVESGAIPLNKCTITQYYYNKQWNEANEPLETHLPIILSNWGVTKF